MSERERKRMGRRNREIRDRLLPAEQERLKSAVFAVIGFRLAIGEALDEGEMDCVWDAMRALGCKGVRPREETDDDR